MKVLVIDDHPLIVEALRDMLRQLAQDVEVHDARTAADGRRLVAAHPDTGLLLLDLSLPDADGFDVLEALHRAHPAVPVVVLSAADHRANVLRAIDLGAMGFIPKASSSQVMLQALRLVLSGGVYLPTAALAHHDEAPAAMPGLASAPGAVGTLRTSVRDLRLTSRQAQVLALILQGKPNKAICRELGLAEGTVKIHVAAILRALNVSTRTQAVVEASRLGLHVDGPGAEAVAAQPRH